MRFGLQRLLLVIAAVCVGLAVWSPDFMSLPLREMDKENAAKAMTAWLIEGGQITGFPDAYGDAKFVKNKKQLFLVCDFVSPDASLSNDPRVVRVSPEKDKEMYETHGFGETDYIGMKKIAESSRLIVVELTNHSARTVVTFTVLNSEGRFGD